MVPTDLETQGKIGKKSAQGKSGNFFHLSKKSVNFFFRSLVETMCQEKLKTISAHLGL